MNESRPRHHVPEGQNGESTNMSLFGRDHVCN